jgi:hypothetical protein
MTLKVEENQDGSFEISWDPNDPVESIFNTWTEEQFIDAIMQRVNEVSEHDEQELDTSC